MQPPTLQTRTDEFDQRNLWLQLLLGLTSYGERLATFIERDAPTGAARTLAETGCSDAGEATIVDACLGLCAIRSRLQSILNEVPEPDPPEPAPAKGSTARPESLRDLLR